MHLLKLNFEDRTIYINKDNLIHVEFVKDAINERTLYHFMVYYINTKSFSAKGLTEEQKDRIEYFLDADVEREFWE